MTSNSANATDSPWRIDVLFWIVVTIGVVAGAWALGHDFSACDPTYEMCEIPASD